MFSLSFLLLKFYQSTVHPVRTLFEAQSKVLDSEALTGLVRLSLGLKTSDRTPIPDGPKGPYPTEQRFARMLKIRRGGSRFELI